LRNELDIKANIWINANAGSGKTTILIKRILKLILNGTKPQNIVAITYTNAGADEIQKRFFDTILRWKTASDDELIEEIREIGENIDISVAKGMFDRIILSGLTLSVYTIHAFCYKMLEDISKTSDGEFEVMTIDQDIANGEIMDSVIAKTADFIYDFVLNGDEVQKESANNFFLEIGEKSLQTFIYNILNCDDFDNKNFVATKTVAELEKNVYNDICKFDLEIIANTMLSGNIYAKKRAEKIIQWMKFNEEEKIEYLDFLCEAFLTSNKIGTNHAKLDVFDELANILYNFIVEKNNLITNNFAIILPQIANFIKTYYKNLKNTYKIWDYNDVLDETIKIIKNNANLWVLYNMSYKIDHFLLDEAQDTNEKSWDIIEVLTNDFFVGYGNRDIERTVFIVGDEKQSIFSFQGARFELFEQKRQLFEEKSRNAKIPFFVVNLNISYRSNPDIIRLVNNLCKDEVIKKSITTAENVEHFVCDRMQNVSGAIDIIEVEIEKKETEIFLINDQNKQDGIEYLEATHSAVLSLKNKGFLNKDIMILMRKRGAKNDIMFNLFNYLQKNGISVGSVDKIKINEHIVFYDFLAMLNFFNNPKNDLNLACFLGSIFCNYSFEKIDTLCKNRLKNNINLYDQLLLEKDDTAQNILSNGLDQIIWSANASGYGDIGEQIAGILINKLTSPEYTSCSLLQMIDKISNLQETVSQQNDEDAIKLSTIHGSKGLESKAVILIDVVNNINQDTKFEKGGLIKLDKNNVVVLLSDYRNSVVKNYVENNKELQKQEEMRLLYVAITRAKNHITIIAPKTKNTDNYSSFGKILNNSCKLI
jgi:ATP-dependent helicase/nuclease subunit A